MSIHRMRHLRKETNMIIISLLGMDSIYAIDVTKKLHKPLVEAFGCEENELMFFAPQSFLIHNGIEQTSFHLNIEIEAPYDYEDREQEIKAALIDNLSDVAIHLRIVFKYFDPERETLLLDETYPEYMTEDNTVKAAHHHHDQEEIDEYDEEDEEPYIGDIIEKFDAYIKEHPNASSDEVYQALTEIREEVTDEHHENGDEGEE